MNKKQRKANRRRWLELIQELVAEGFLSVKKENAVSRYFPHNQHNEQAILWETPKDQKTPISKPCASCKRCGHCGAHHGDMVESPVYVTPLVWAKIRALMDHFDRHEWGGYFLNEDNGVFTELVIPPQTAHSATWVADAGATNDLVIVGVIHSHVKMGVFHSKDDDENLMANFPVSVIVSKKHDDTLEWEAVRSVRMECGALYRYKTTVHMTLDDQSTWLDEAKQNVRTKDFQPGFLTERPSYAPPGGYHHVQVGLCDKQRWCYRDKHHKGSCSENREEFLCVKTDSCVLVRGHKDSCSVVGTPKDPKNGPAGAQQRDYDTGSAWHEAS